MGVGGPIGIGSSSAALMGVEERLAEVAGGGGAAGGGGRSHGLVRAAGADRWRSVRRRSFGRARTAASAGDGGRSEKGEGSAGEGAEPAVAPDAGEGIGHECG